MAYLFVVLLVCLILAWVWSEYLENARSTRLSLGGLAILLLGASLFATIVANQYRQKHYSASIRMLGETLEQGDIESAQNAIRAFNLDPEATGSLIIERLSNTRSGDQLESK